MATLTPKRWYVLFCQDCDDASYLMPIPFETPEARGKWAAEHRAGTGHDRWRVLDQPRKD